MEKIVIKTGDHFVNTYTGKDRELTFDMQDGSAMDIFVMSDNESGLQQITVNTARDCRLSITTIDLGGADFKRETAIHMNNEGAECALNGVFVTAGNEHTTNNTMVRHMAEKCRSEQTFRGVASGNSKAAFAGHIYVAHGAQETVALQENHNMLLSDTARIETRPQLEIYADNVKCNHGATVGRQDASALFYLRQRGIEPRAAQALLTEGFCRAAINLTLFSEELQDAVYEKLTAKLLSL